MINGWHESADSLIGKKWDKLSYNCYSFVRELSEIMGRILPILPIDGSNVTVNTLVIHKEITLQRWIHIKVPSEGDIVLLGNQRLAYHVGIVINCNPLTIAHCSAESNGVSIMKASHLYTYGWNIHGYRRYNCED